MPMLISMHMEKCGGTSMEVLLRQQYGLAFQLYDPGYPDDPQAFNSPDEGINCLHGHMYYGLHRQLADRKCSYITLLRDPVSRFLSNYRHIRRYKHPLQKLINSQDGLSEMCENPQARHYRNLFVRRLAGIDGEPCGADMEKAEDRLRQFALVGKVEQFEAFVCAATTRLGWSAYQIPHKNAANSDPQDGVSSAELEQVIQANALDIELFERVADIIA
ncbi:MAG: sulfotransferase family protein [Xanthomonadales bacterium]|nr:sulfotransferase family protein [Xanthomonadales bacterium]